jgi:Ca2+/Na+ antiporter
MKDLIRLIVQVVNIIHDLLMDLFNSMGYTLTDKDLHFWVIGIIGMFLFVFTHLIFKVISKWSIMAISFVYTFTVLIIIVFAIEIEQKITGRGNMEFADVMAGLYGFLVLFLVFVLIKLLISSLAHLISKKRQRRNNRINK